MTGKPISLILLILSSALNSLLVYSQGLDGKLIQRNTRLLDKQSVQVMIKGSTVEVIGGRSVNERTLASGDVQFEVVSRSQNFSKLSATNPILVFNHGLGEYGFITGEIAIKFRQARDIRSFPTSEFLGFSKVGNLDIYTVQASSAEQFAAYIKNLSARKDLLWVEPTIQYVPEIKSDKIRY